MPEHSVTFSPEQTGTQHLTGPKTLYSGIARDSRAVAPGDVFYYLSSDKSHLQDAIARGASAVVIAENEPLPSSLAASIAVYRADGDLREHLAHAAALCFPSPELLHICAVTGTNGKTSVAHIYRSLISSLDTAALSIGTLGMIPEGAQNNAQPLDFGLTTPDTITLHRALHRYSAVHNISALSIEISSHGLDQRRCDGLRFNAAVFTNFTEDHIDYHKTTDAYLSAKRRIFTLTRPGGLAIINADIPECPLLIQDAFTNKLRPLTVGYNETADWRISSRKDTKGGGQKFTLTADKQDHALTLSLSGGFQAYNACFALAAAVDAFPEHQDKLCNALAQLTEIPGRMQRISPNAAAHLPAVYVDFAHTPDALINAARALKEQTLGRLIIVIGCGGDRDTEKRLLMGRAAAENGDRVVITDDNPRTENAAAIRLEIMRGCCPDAENISPREDALATAILNARPEDTVLVAGKGHENYQIIGTEKIPYSDIETALALLKKYHCKES